MATLSGTPISSKFFTSHEGQLIAESSTLEHAYRSGWQHRVYDDACDVGCTILSERTGRTITFVECDHIRDGEGELVATVLRPADLRTRRQFPSLEVHVLND